MKRIKSKKNLGGLIGILFLIMASLSITAFVLEVMPNKDCPSSENFSDEDSGCEQCSEDTYNDGSSLTCQPCPAGEVAIPGSSKCVKKPPTPPTPCEVCGGDCQKQTCPDGQTCTGPPGHFQCTTCPDGTWSRPTSASTDAWGTSGQCLTCPKNATTKRPSCSINIWSPTSTTIPVTGTGGNACAPEGSFPSNKEAICFNGKWVAKTKSGYPCDDNNQCDGDNACGLFNDQISGYHEKRCCPSRNWWSSGTKGWCKQLENGDPCIYNIQCKSDTCSPGGTPDSVCT